ncbi:MAG: hypothetical protein DMF63_01070 [Acidobacteria bacterium]|nr:MAG: hypothetical protein DMF63_01070 [Acidobacteriota bacterium]
MTNPPETDSDSLVTIYSQKIRTIRTRSCTLEIPERENEVSILHTLLGIELQIGRRRFSCPDLPTARYMRVFARLGCSEFAIPYDITKISTLADELETSWQRALLLLKTTTAGLTERQVKRRRSEYFKIVRMEIAAIGPGEKMPLFNQSTKQRTS